MKSTSKDRRSRRIPAAHRLLLTIVGGAGSEIAKEIVSTVELSQFGARVRGRRMLRPESEGVLTQLSSGRQARVRIAWQQKAPAPPGFLDTGLEILSGFDYWGDSFTESAVSPAPLLPLGSNGLAPLTVEALLNHLKEQSGSASGLQPLETIWCGLIEQLEARKVLSREDLIAAVRSIAPRGAPAVSKISPPKK